MSKELLQIPMTINASMIRRETVDGAECVIINSATLPDNVVMNGGLYPAEEIANSFMTLERVLAPAGHPEKNGKYISAKDPYAIHNFDVGAYVANVERKNGKVYHDTIINIDVANRSEKGRELLGAINKMESDGKPIHTSTGVLLERQPLDEIQTNDDGAEYSWIAHNISFDHNAILINQVGAATPEQGVGLMVNAADVDLATFEVSEEFDDKSIREAINALQDNLREKLSAMESAEYLYIEDVTERAVVYEIGGEGDYKCYRREYSIMDGELSISDTRIEVKRRVKWVTNALKTFIKRMGFAHTIDTAYNEQATNSTSNEVLDMTPEEKAAFAAEIAKTVQANLDIQDAVASAVKPLADRLSGLEANAESAEKAERAPLETKAEAKGLSADEIKAMSTNALKIAFGADVAGSATYAAGGEPQTNSADTEFSRDLP